MAMLNNQMVDILYFMHTRTHAHNISQYYRVLLSIPDFH